MDRTNKKSFENALKEIWNYMKLDFSLEKCDIIIGCGCANLDIPKKCADLLKKGYASIILFAGGKGKITENDFNKSEAEIYREIAIKNGIKDENIIIETESKNTGDNFRFAMNILKEKNIHYEKILIVHKSFNERRTYSTALAIFKDKKILITSPNITFKEYLEKLYSKTKDEIMKEVSVIVGDIQRLIIYPQFGWMIENEIPKNVIEAYYYLKELGFSKYIISKKQISELIKKYGIIKGQKENYFN